VTLRGHAVGAEPTQRARVEIAIHGRLQDLEAVTQAMTILDLAAARPVRSTGDAPALLLTRSGFFAEFREAVRRRVPLLEREGLVRRETGHGARDAEHRLAAAVDAEERIELAMKQREMRPLTFAEVARLGGKTVEKARLAVAAQERFAPGRELRAMAEVSESGAGRRRTLAWVLEDLERERKRDRGRER